MVEKRKTRPDAAGRSEAVGRKVADGGIVYRVGGVQQRRFPQSEDKTRLRVPGLESGE